MNKIRHRGNIGDVLKDLNGTGIGIEIGVDTGLFSEIIIKNFGLSNKACLNKIN